MLQYGTGVMNGTQNHDGMSAPVDSLMGPTRRYCEQYDRPCHRRSAGRLSGVQGVYRLSPDLTAESRRMT